MTAPYALEPLRKIRRYGPSKRGPEARLMRALKSWALSSDEHDAQWGACGLPIGAGEPDLVLVSCRPELRGLRNMSVTHARLLAYLAEVNISQPRTIARRTGVGLVDVDRAFEELVSVGAVEVRGRRVAIMSGWKDILVDTVAVEAKVTDWRRGAAQAARNRVFAQRSFLALPQRTAERVCTDPLIERLGIGVLAVADSGVTLVREAPTTQPLIWFYYYSLAVAVAGSLGRGRRGF